MKAPRQTVIDNFRNGVLFALDDQARRNFRGVKLPISPGGSDADLSLLFKTLDDHVDRLAQRYGVELTEGGAPDNEVD